MTTKSLVIYRSVSLSGEDSSSVGITVSKSIGKAVTRNKVRRRLAAILHEALASHPAMRLLVIPRPIAAVAHYWELQAEIASALPRAGG